MKFDYFVLGYIELKIECEDVALAASRLLRAGLYANINAFGILKIPYFKKEKYKRALVGVRYKEHLIGGGAALALAIIKRPAAIFALAAVIALSFILSDLVWDVRIEGNEEMTSVGLAQLISTTGLDVGARWSKLSLAKVEREVLEECTELAWVNINRRGTVAVIRVRERESAQQNATVGGYSSIVAEYDCIIEDISVIRGVAAVAEGDSVKAGDVLISGIVSSEDGTSFCHAEGNIIGRVFEENSVEVGRCEDLYTYGEQI